MGCLHQHVSKLCSLPFCLCCQWWDPKVCHSLRSHIPYVIYSPCVINQFRKNILWPACWLSETRLLLPSCFSMLRVSTHGIKVILTVLCGCIVKFQKWQRFFWISFKKSLAHRSGLKLGWLTVLQKYSSGKNISWKTIFSLSTFPPSYICFYMLWLWSSGPSYAYLRVDLHGHIDELSSRRKLLPCGLLLTDTCCEQRESFEKGCQHNTFLQLTALCTQ